MRAGLALALLLAVAVSLLFASAARQFAHQLGGHDVARPGDVKASVVHAEKD